MRENLKLKLDSKIVLCAGYADHRKGVDLFVETAIKVTKENKNIFFVWVGSFESKIQEYIKNKFSLNHANIIFIPTQPEVSLYFAGADLYLLTSREDPFPSVVLEAMNVGVPVIGFKDAGGFQDIVNNNTGKLVEYENTQELTKTTIELLEDNDKLKIL